jgi:hypothetical protein
MLNKASIDIDQEPLGDYENDHIGLDDAEDVEEVEGGDDELEEVDVGTYEDAASAVTQYTTACCSVQVVDITLMKYRFVNITFLRVVQQKHCGSATLHVHT